MNTDQCSVAGKLFIKQQFKNYFSLLFLSVGFRTEMVKRAIKVRLHAYLLQYFTMYVLGGINMILFLVQLVDPVGHLISKGRW